MLDYIKGTINKLTPTYVIVETGGLGFFANISLSTFNKLHNRESITLLVHEIIREDIYQLYGFADEIEREIFRLLISVTGVGAGTARIMLSSLQPEEIQTAIAKSDVNVLKGVKGIGLKTAQRIVVDLKDKIDKKGDGDLFSIAANDDKDEAAAALVMLGFSKNAVNKVLNDIVKKNGSTTVETMIKEALKLL